MAFKHCENNRGGTAMNKRNDVNVYIWSSLHLGHGNVIKYCDRPFADVTEMNTALLHTRMEVNR
jgi:calcineurin-like phosphoesterase family protein